MKQTKNLTKQQKKVYDFINLYLSENGISPTIEEIRKSLKLKAISTIHAHVTALYEKNYINRLDNTSRNIVPLKNVITVIDIPIIGSISAGKPIDIFEEVQGSIQTTSNIAKNSRDYYSLKVLGNSMQDEGIYDGDFVVIKRQVSAENGQTVVAIIDDGKATLKELYKEKNRFRLQPKNQTMLPFYRDQVEVRGVVVQVIRNVSKSTSQKFTQGVSKLRTIDLFAGVGGIRLGFENAGFNTVFANDFEQKCKDTYDINFRDSKLVVEDIRKIEIDDLPEFDFLLGGFPCQAFSIAGHRQGFNDLKGRGNLFFDIARILEARRPEGFLLENVKNLKSHDDGRTFEIIENSLKSLGYYLKIKVLNSLEYGNIPQNRERIYIVGFKNKDYFDQFEFPEAIPLTRKISDLLQESVDEKYYYEGKPLYAKLKGKIKQGKVYQWRRQYVRENKKGVSPTLTANMGMGGHNVPIIKDNVGIRKLTPLECARIQGFPVSYKLPNIADSALYKQFGNSVCIPVIERIAINIKKAVT